MVHKISSTPTIQSVHSQSVPNLLFPRFLPEAWSIDGLVITWSHDKENGHQLIRLLYQPTKINKKENYEITHFLDLKKISNLISKIKSTSTWSNTEPFVRAIGTEIEHLKIINCSLKLTFHIAQYSAIKWFLN